MFQINFFMLLVLLIAYKFDGIVRLQILKHIAFVFA